MLPTQASAAVESGALEAARGELAVRAAQLAEVQLAEEAASEKAVALEHALAEGRQALPHLIIMITEDEMNRKT
jgi:hypothetical protein